MIGKGRYPNFIDAAKFFQYTVINHPFGMNAPPNNHLPKGSSTSIVVFKMYPCRLCCTRPHPLLNSSRPLGQLAQVLKLVARMVLVPSGLFDIASTCLRLIFAKTCSDKFALKIWVAWWKQPLFFGHFRLQCNCKDQSGELQRLSNEASFWRTGSLGS